MKAGVPPSATNNVQRILEPGVTAFSAAEVHVAVVPVGDVPLDVLEKYCSLITRHRQVELQSIQPFYIEQQKSPFKFFPWKNGSMNFRFIREQTAVKTNPLTALHAHRNVLGVIGICHCPTNADLSVAYELFETAAKQFQGAMALRCFAFQPSSEQVTSENQRKEKKANLMMFPPTDTDGLEKLESHASFLMLEFAAALLGEMERWMLTASPAMVDLNTFADASEKFLGPSSVFSDMQKRFPASTDEEMVRKRRYGRLQKAMGDFSLLAGSPADAADHYTTAAELSRICNDSIWCAAALVGMANAKVLEECLKCGAIIGAAEADNGDTSFIQPSKRAATLRSTSQVSATSGGFGGQQFWELLRDSPVEREARHFYAEARLALPKRGGLPLQVEASLQLARLLAGLHGVRARREVSEIASSIMDAGIQLALLDDRLTVMMEAAQILGLVGSARKRTLVLWQAVEFSRAHEMAVLDTLQIARKALEPPDDPRDDPRDADEADLVPHNRPLAGGVPQHWSSVRCACIEGVLSTAILASRHADVWDAAALLLREHWRDLPNWRQESLLRTLDAAASQMSEADLKRPGPGPPPLITFVRAVAAPPHLQPRHIAALTTPASKVAAAPAESTPFIYNPSEARSREDKSKEAAAQAAAQWICGETATVEVQIWNPTSQPIKVERVTIEAEHVVDPSVAPRDQHASPPAWKPYAFAMNIPPNSAPSKVQLTGVPLEKGLYTVTGCTVTLNRVAWHQPWSPLPAATPAAAFRPHPAIGEAGGIAEARVTVAEALPLLRGRIKAPQTSAAPEDSSAPATPVAEPEAAPQPLTIAALKGQVLGWELAVQNAGKITVTNALVSVTQRPGGARSLGLHLGQDKLAKQLPLKALAVARVPLMLHHRQVANFHEDEEAGLDLTVTYHASAAAPPVPEDSEAPPPPEPLGRCLVLPAHVKFLPSLQVNGAAFFVHHQACSGKQSSGTARRRCVLELDIVNRAPVALQVWIGHRVAPKPGSKPWQAVADSPRPWQAGGSPSPGSPPNLACKIAAAHTAVLVAAFADTDSDREDETEMTQLTAGSRQGLQHRERRLADKLAQQLSIYWRREDLHDKSVAMEIGSLPLPPDLLESAMSPMAMDILEPPAVSVCFTACRATGGDAGSLESRQEQLLLAAGEDDGRGQQRRGAVWGHVVAIGEPVQLSMKVANEGEEDCTFEASVSCHSTDVPGDSERCVEDHNVMCSGMLHHLNFDVPRGGIVSHSFAACFLSQGLYQVYACELLARTQGAGGGLDALFAVESPKCSVLPAYILVR